MGIISDKVPSQVWQNKFETIARIFPPVPFRDVRFPIWNTMCMYLRGSSGEKYDDNNLTLIPLTPETIYVCCLLVPVSHYQTPILPIPSRRRSNRRRNFDGSFWYDAYRYQIREVRSFRHGATFLGTVTTVCVC